MTDSDTLPNPFELGGCVYYSQNREDLILHSFFPDVKKGTYVDIGGFDPDYDSVTKLFYLKGWSGINIEPQQDRYKLFVKRRTRDTNLNVGVSDKHGKLTLRAYNSGGLSTFADDIKKDYESHSDADTDTFTESVVPVMTLKDILTKNPLKHIHFMKIDVEGLEYDVLAGNDWKRFRPEVLCIESNHILKDWRPLLKEAAYELVFNDGLNDYYCDSRTDRKSKFDLVKEVIHDRGGGIRSEHYDMMITLYDYAKDKAHHVEELVTEQGRLRDELNEQRGELAGYEGLRYTARHLASLIKRKLVGSEHKESS